MTLPVVSASAFRLLSDGFVNRRCQHHHSPVLLWGRGSWTLDRNSAKQFQHEKGATRTSLGGEGYFARNGMAALTRTAVVPDAIPLGALSAELRRPGSG